MKRFPALGASLALLLDGLERGILRSVGYGGEIVAHAVTGRAANEQRIDVQRREPGCDGLFAASGGEEQGERCCL